MSSSEATFKIIENQQCPIYEHGDEFKISGKSFLSENKMEKKLIHTSVFMTQNAKPICHILAGDITAVFIEHKYIENIPECVIKCRGCTGSVQLEYKIAQKNVNNKVNDHDTGFARKLLTRFPIFRSLNDEDIEKLVPMLKMKKFPKGSTILKKGDPGTNLYIMLSGRAEVLVEDDMGIGMMKRGDVFGEISLLIGTPVGATIRVVEPVTVLLIYGRDFKKVLNMFPSMQMYFAQLLAERLAKTNVERSEEFASGMVGKLSENPPSELFQTLNLNHKTGRLTLMLPRGDAELVFREGDLIIAAYGQKNGHEAFFEILKENEGRFKFSPGLPPDMMKIPEIGDFMWLLMEGTRRMDEEIQSEIEVTVENI